MQFLLRPFQGLGLGLALISVSAAGQDSSVRLSSPAISNLRLLSRSSGYILDGTVLAVERDTQNQTDRSTSHWQPELPCLIAVPQVLRAGASRGQRCGLRSQPIRPMDLDLNRRAYGTRIILWVHPPLKWRATFRGPSGTLRRGLRSKLLAGIARPLGSPDSSPAFQRRGGSQMISVP